MTIVISRVQKEYLHKLMALFLLAMAVGAFVITWNIYIL
jgi:hypothetical protein